MKNLYIVEEVENIFRIVDDEDFFLNCFNCEQKLEYDLVAVDKFILYSTWPAIDHACKKSVVIRPFPQEYSFSPSDRVLLISIQVAEEKMLIVR
jgi:hypothetical protein